MSGAARSKSKIFFKVSNY